MKKSIFMVALAAIVAVSCSKEQQSIKNPQQNSAENSQLLQELGGIDNQPMGSENPILTFIENYYVHYNGITDIETIKDYISDGTWTEYERNNIYLAYGYESNAAFLAYYKIQGSLAMEVERQYDFSKLSHSEQIQIINPFVIGSPFNPGGEEPVNETNCDSYECCKGNHTACIITGMAEATAGYLLCARSGPYYPLCATVVFMDQIEHNEGCDAGYNTCMHNRR